MSDGDERKEQAGHTTNNNNNNGGVTTTGVTVGYVDAGSDSAADPRIEVEYVENK